jgi:N-methylhydantoinase B/acetone carboxylase, alpha subunit
VSASDPISAQIVGAMASGVVREMQEALFRTGYSTIIREEPGRQLRDPDAGRNAGPRSMWCCRSMSAPSQTACADVLRLYPRA